jgi:Lrp/AsnC family leucine-responsive transcriptional regulator
MVAAPPVLDEIDQQILGLLRQDGRRTVKDIASRVNLTAAPVKRRIERLEKVGVITGYTVLVNEAKLGPTLSAFTELRYAGDMDQDEILSIVCDVPEVVRAYTMAGEVDALVKIRARNIDHLQEVIAKLRQKGHPVSTRTLIVLKQRYARLEIISAIGDDLVRLRAREVSSRGA